MSKSVSQRNRARARRAKRKVEAAASRARRAAWRSPHKLRRFA